MHRLRNYAIIIPFFLLLFSCSEKYDIENNIDTNKIVIEGFLFNHEKIAIPDRYNDSLHAYYYSSYIKIHKINSTLSSIDVGYHENGIGISNALVIISDEIGNIDTFQHIDCRGFDLSDYGHYTKCGFKAVPNRKYYLYVKLDDKEYTAEAFMPSVPDMDSINIPDDFFEDGSVENNFIEGIKVFFNEPTNTKDYYLFTIEHHTNISTFSSNMKTIIDDKFLSLDISTDGFMLDDGQNKEFWRNNYASLQLFLRSGDPVTVLMHGITKDAYDFHKTLMSQVNNDGGVFSPTPATPKGNISNGAYGYFRASSVSIITGYKN